MTTRPARKSTAKFNPEYVERTAADSRPMVVPQKGFNLLFFKAISGLIKVHFNKLVILVERND
jgi:hypothetical protein